MSLVWLMLAGLVLVEAVLIAKAVHHYRRARRFAQYAEQALQDWSDK